MGSSVILFPIHIIPAMRSLVTSRDKTGNLGNAARTLRFPILPCRLPPCIFATVRVFFPPMTRVLSAPDSALDLAGDDAHVQVAWTPRCAPSVADLCRLDLRWGVAHADCAELGQQGAGR